MTFRPRRATVAWGLAVLTLGSAAVTFAQGRRFFGMSVQPQVHNVKYDGRFTFVRLKFSHGGAGYYHYGMPAWAHGFVLEGPSDSVAEDSLVRILDAVSSAHPRLDGSNVLALDDPELFKYPICYMTEAGFWDLTDKEAVEFRAYLQKGGFVIFDDFREGHGAGGWWQFEDNMHKILPGSQILDMTPDDQIFHVFFDIDSFNIIPQYYDRGQPVLRGIFEDNDRHKRLMAMINYNTDVSQFWEYSSTGTTPVDASNQAYKLGVNYLIYGLTH